MERLASRHLFRNYSYYSQLKLKGHVQSNTQTVRYFSRNQPPEKPQGFFARVIENIKTEFSQNPEIKEGLAKFRQETQKLEDTEAIRKAREKFKVVEQESEKNVSEVLQSAKETFKSGVEKAKEAEFIKKTVDKAKGAADEFSKQGERFKNTSTYKKISEVSSSVEEELDNVDMISSLYRPPKKLLKRAERSGLDMSQRVVQPNEEIIDVELHKDSKWSQNWKKFKDDNPYMNKIFEFKRNLDESDNPIARVTKNFVDKISDTVGGLFQTTDLSNVLTEICKVDPSFNINDFLIDCEKFIIPNILESLCQDQPDVLSDWCHEAVFNVLYSPYKEAKKLGLKINSRIVDIQNIELAMGKMMDQGPVLVITFQAQQLSYVTDSKGNVVEGDADKIMQNSYVMAFCRDESDLDPKTAWKLIDVAMQQSQFVF